MGARHFHGHIDKRGHSDLMHAHSYESRPGSPFIKLDIEMSLDSNEYTVWKQWENNNFITWKFPISLEGLNQAIKKFEEQYEKAEKKFRMQISMTKTAHEHRRLMWLDEKTKKKTATKGLPATGKRLATKKEKLKALIKEMKLEEKELIELYKEIKDSPQVLKNESL